MKVVALEKKDVNYGAVLLRNDGAEESLKRKTWGMQTTITLLRPRQWIKNVFLFAGLIFSYSFFDPLLIFYSLLAFLSFCLLSSCAYIINDIIDIKEDKAHYWKKFRPLASGAMAINQAVIVMIPLLLFAFAIAWHINLLFFLCGLLYFSLTVSYSIWLKHIVIIDVLAIAFGFLLRALAGGFAIEVAISFWFLVCTLLLSLFLALTKRRQESVNLESNGGNRRKVLTHYPLTYLDQLISKVTVATIICYSLYTFTASQSKLFALTIPFVVYGIFRYRYLAYSKDLGESPEEVLLQDKPMIINLLLWAVLSISILVIEHKGLI